MTAPVALEACGVMQTWKDHGWDLDYIIDQSLKWHISSFNNKSSAVPAEWQSKVDRWLKRMGYRFVLRSFSYPAVVSPQGKFPLLSWWENKGVAPIYRSYILALRLRNSVKDVVLPTAADIRKWLPGDSVYEDSGFVPADLPIGDYEVSVAILDPLSRIPKVKLAIEGRQPDGWYVLGQIHVQEKAPTWSGGKFPPP